MLYFYLGNIQGKHEWLLPRLLFTYLSLHSCCVSVTIAP